MDKTLDSGRTVTIRDDITLAERAQINDVRMKQTDDGIELVGMWPLHVKRLQIGLAKIEGVKATDALMNTLSNDEIMEISGLIAEAVNPNGKKK